MRSIILSLGMMMVAAFTAESDTPAKHAGISECEHKSMATMDVMHKKMAAMKMSGQADVDFAQMMAIHHQGAIDMSKVYLECGKDSMLKEMAAKMIKDQEAEIKMLNEFVAKNIKQ